MVESIKTVLTARVFRKFALDSFVCQNDEGINIKRENCGVAVLAYKEELLIRRVIDTMPVFVDEIAIVDDCSKDNRGLVFRDAQRCNQIALCLLDMK